MAKKSLYIVDGTGKRIGVLFLNVDPPTESPNIFESAAPFLETESHPQLTVEKRNFWASDGASYMLAGVFTGVVLLAFSWWYAIPMGVIVAAGALFVGVGLHVLKIVLHKPPAAAPQEPGAKESVIKIEQISDNRQHWLIEQLDESITMSDLEPVARAVTEQNKWTRAITTRAGLSQGKHQKLQSDFVRLHYLEPFPNGANGYRVTGMGRRFLLQVSST